MELCPLREVQRLQLDNAVLLRAVRHVDAFVDSQSVDLAELVVDVGTQRTDAIGAKRHRFGRLMVELFVNFRTFHEVDYPFSARETEPGTGGRLLIRSIAGYNLMQVASYCWLYLVMDVSNEGFLHIKLFVPFSELPQSSSQARTRLEFEVPL